MRFETIPVEQAFDCLLAHSLRVGGRRWSKGRRLAEADLPLLAAEGVRQVTVARLEADDLGEDQVADALGRLLAGAGAEPGAAFTGRCNLYAAADGIAQLDVAALQRLNRLDEALTVATVPAFSRVRRGQMLATVKVIPFAVPAPLLARAQREVAAAAVAVAPFRSRGVALVHTELAAAKPSLAAKAEQAVRSRLAQVNAELLHVGRCAHRQDALAAALQAALATAGVELVLINAASAVTDRRDVIPAALEQVGGSVERFGMPVDPGNLLLLGRHQGVPVIGLPGCARSPKLNGFDWVLQRVCADLPVDREVIADMGIGGLLQEVAERPQPRAGVPVELPQRARIAALVLAAGHSRRMGSRNKLLAGWQRRPLLRHAVDHALASGAEQVVVVTGHEGSEVAASLRGLPVVIVHNPDYASGMASSLQAGLRALPPTVDGVLVCLGDMPHVQPQTLDRLIAAFAPVEGRAICLPTYGGKRGNPVLLGRQLFPELARLEGDRGARRLIERHEEWVCEVAVEDPGVLLDVDTPAALDALQRLPARDAC